MDINLLKQKFEKLNKSGNSATFDNIMADIPYGTTTVRLVPNKFKKDIPFIEQYTYYLNKQSIISNLTFGKEDPISIFRKKLYETKDKNDAELAKSLKATKRILAPVIFRDKQVTGETKVFYWSFSETVYKDLLNYILDPEYGDITDVRKGTDVIIEKMTPAQAGNSFGKTTIRLARKESALSESQEEIDRIVNSFTNVEESGLFKPQPDEKYNEILKKYLDFKELNPVSLVNETINKQLPNTSPTTTLNKETNTAENDALLSKFKGLLDDES